MADRSAIEWTDATWNPIRARARATGKLGWHCEHKSDGCRNCYAERLNFRLGTGFYFKPDLLRPHGRKPSPVEVFLDEDMLLAPLRWKRPRMVFVCSMTDLFADFVADEWIDQLFAVMALCPQHTFQVLTKRAERMRDYLTNLPSRSVAVAQAAVWLGLWDDADGIAVTVNDLIDRGPLPKVWLGVSCERQEEADDRIPLLLQTPAAIKFVSAEPLLGPIDFAPKADATYQLLSEWYGPDGFDPAGLQPRRERRRGYFPRVDWIIVGGESGPKARPMHPQWAREIRDQCRAARVTFFFKQWGENFPCEFDHRGKDGEIWRRHHDGRLAWALDELGAVDPAPVTFLRVGKKAAGRLLDGRTWDEMPARHAEERVA